MLEQRGPHQVPVSATCPTRTCAHCVLNVYLRLKVTISIRAAEQCETAATELHRRDRHRQEFHRVSSCTPVSMTVIGISNDKSHEDERYLGLRILVTSLFSKKFVPFVSGQPLGSAASKLCSPFPLEPCSISVRGCLRACRARCSSTADAAAAGCCALPLPSRLSARSDACACTFKRRVSP